MVVTPLTSSAARLLDRHAAAGVQKITLFNPVVY